MNGKYDGDPRESCCDPLKMVIKKQPECLCSLISNEGSIPVERAGINLGHSRSTVACTMRTTSQSTLLPLSGRRFQELQCSKLCKRLLLVASYGSICNVP
ncbi:Bifunctional inhibitor/plant lipid transfer protein/seed storage helical domain containing protein [Parasponia andersonii]|uniref:Bifunctional inhibitor/plant lipid transfer protein/seed storage helical domain containing protein n=1 Tax=Parasponia andersonii TaxID=3476 RepID=A0A2P5AG30_PARAD|nr:Bifunctional inhibitor/plant lipid transfer protein/seed storage helical domain containing protein [Parasponia andersonii]